MKVTFNGATREVGGSCTTIETEDARIALDYGIKVDEGLSPDMPKELDAVVVTHAHLDHSGNLLTLTDNTPVIIGSKATHDVTIQLLKDLIKVHKYKEKPIQYNFQDVYRISNSWLSREQVALPGMNIFLHPAGHVLGAKMIQLKTEGKTLLYSGDFCSHDTEILDGTNLETLPEKPDALIMESTYGGTVRPTRSELVETLQNKMIETMKRGGNILVPTFAFHRLQEMVRRIDLAMQEKILPHYNAYYISGLAHRITHYYNEHKHLLSEQVSNQENPFSFTTVRRLKRINQIKEPAIVICTSGFGHAGASHTLLLEWANDEDNTVIINTGYLPPNSPLVMAKEGKIIDNGESIQVNANIEQIELSGHSDQKALTEFVEILKPKETFLVHGNLDQAQALSKEIEPFTDVRIPYKNESFRI